MFILILVSIVIVCQIHFDFAERAYVREIAADQISTYNAVNGLYSSAKDLISFDKTELPAQVQDYVSKNSK